MRLRFNRFACVACFNPIEPNSEVNGHHGHQVKPLSKNCATGNTNLHVTNKYLQATSKTKRLAQDKLVDAILPTGILPKTNPIQ